MRVVHHLRPGNTDAKLSGCASSFDHACSIDDIGVGKLLARTVDINRKSVFVDPQQAAGFIDMHPALIVAVIMNVGVRLWLG